MEDEIQVSIETDADLVVARRKDAQWRSAWAFGLPIQP